MALLTALAWLPRTALGAALIGALLVACGGGDDDDANVVAQATQTPPTIASSATVAPPMAAPTEPAPMQQATTQPPATEPPPAPTVDTRVPIRDLPSVNQIQLDEDGTYYIADRGDGCTWLERFRRTYAKVGEEVTLSTDCRADFQIIYRPGSGEVFIQVP